MSAGTLLESNYGEVMQVEGGPPENLKGRDFGFSGRGGQSRRVVDYRGYSRIARCRNAETIPMDPAVWYT